MKEVSQVTADDAARDRRASYEADPKIYLIRIYEQNPAGGEPSRLLAEAPLIVYDPDGAWRVFTESWGRLAEKMAGEVFEAFRLATGRGLHRDLGDGSIKSYVAVAMTGSPKEKGV